MLSLEVDPKLAWALAHRERFPVDLNRAPKEMLLRVPGLGVKSVGRVLQARRVRRLRAADLERMHLPLAKLLPFVVVADHRPGPRARRRRPGPPPRAPAAARVAVRLSAGRGKRAGVDARSGRTTAAWNRANTPPTRRRRPGPATPPRRAP